VAVMYLGKLMEVGDCNSLYKNPLHPYTISLLSAAPIPDPQLEARRERIILHGERPSLTNPPPGCAFHSRCPQAVNECRESVPPLRELEIGHQVACILA
jgi:oligopeptide transport system ATP-binding protein